MFPNFARASGVGRHTGVIPFRNVAIAAGVAGEPETTMPPRLRNQLQNPLPASWERFDLNNRAATRVGEPCSRPAYSCHLTDVQATKTAE